MGEITFGKWLWEGSSEVCWPGLSGCQGPGRVFGQLKKGRSQRVLARLGRGAACCMVGLERVSQQTLLVNAIYKAALVTFRSPELWQQHEAMTLPRGN